ncbi:MAG TPA: tetratricopeptide repeat protein [Thermodesulfovibrionales bacterium]|nr:tetratricopeptide repeat protein [Thermodesulfovibrionales bacterium]
MSLIMDALKKAQQFRLKESKRSPFFNDPNLKGGEKQKRGKYLWIFAIAGSVTLLLLFFFWSSLLPLLTSQQRRDISGEKKEAPIYMEAKNELQKPMKEEASPIQKEKLLLSMKSTAEKKKEEPLTTQVVNQEKIRQIKTDKNTSAGKELSPTTNSQKEEASSAKQIESVQAVEKDTPVKDVLTYFNMGVDFYRQREITKAIHAYQKVIELDPAYVEAYNNLGIIYQDLGDFDKALNAYQTSIKINPRYEKAYNNLGIVLFLNGRYEESKEAFQNALNINPNNIESYINLGILYNKQGQFEKAIEYYQKALTINPLNGETHYNIGLLYEQLGNLKIAIGYYQKFIQLCSKTHPDLVSKVRRHLDYLMTIKGAEVK